MDRISSIRTIVAICVLATSLSALTQDKVEVEPLNIRPEGRDFAPFLLDSGFVMCSIREGEGLVTYMDAQTALPLSDMYFVPYKEGKAGTPIRMSAALNSEVNDGPATFCDGGRSICFTRNLATPKKLGNFNARNDRLGLFFSRYQNGEWEQPIPFEHNSTDHSVMHAAFSSDGRSLVFASDMPGGSGGTDLYVCHLENDQWSRPKNLGPTVNSSANELFPFLTEKGTLYFSSDRAGGMGGLDLYASMPTNHGWAAATPLPEPFNSAANDMGYTAAWHDRSGLISSDREGTGKIYSFRRTIEPFQDCVEQRANNYCYHFEANDVPGISDLPLRREWDLGDSVLLRGNSASHCYAGPGRFTVTSYLVDTTTGAVFYREGGRELVIEDIRQAYIQAADSVRRGANVSMDATMTNLPNMDVVEYRWDFGDAETAVGARVRHSYRYPGDRMVRMDAIGVPDEDGRVPHQCVMRPITVLEKRPAANDAVLASYQDASGVTREFSYQDLPFDEITLVASNDPDASFTIRLFASKERVSLTDPRFTEVRKFATVVERYDPKQAVYTYSVGDSKELPTLFEVFRKVKQLRFLDAEVMVLHPEEVVDMSSLSRFDIQRANTTIVRASTVLFATNKATLEAEFERSLLRMAALLRDHRELAIVIEAHTDSQGSDKANLTLSEKRARTVAAYLVAQGIETERMVSIGFGESQPIASNDNEDGRRQNRRVDFRLTLREEVANAGAK